MQKQYAEVDEETVKTKWLEAPKFHMQMAYDEFLEKLSLTDRKDDLAEYLAHPNELTELAQMDAADLEEDILKDLSFDEETMERFRAEEEGLDRGRERDTILARADSLQRTQLAAIDVECSLLKSIQKLHSTQHHHHGPTHAFALLEKFGACLRASYLPVSTSRH
jgi:hypothetical protein